MHTRSTFAALRTLAGWLALLALAGCGSRGYEQRLAETLDSRRQGEIAAAREELGVDEESADSQAAAGPSRPARVLEGEEWGFDFAQLRELGSAVSIEGYVVRPPQGYERFEMSLPGAPPGMQVLPWRGVEREDGSIPVFTVQLALRPADATGPGETASAGLRAAIQGMSSRFSGLQSSAEEKGHVGETEFVRTRFSGTETNSGHKFHGFMYVGLDDRAAYFITGMDVEPHHTQSLPIMEAAAMTFSRK